MNKVSRAKAAAFGIVIGVIEAFGMLGSGSALAVVTTHTMSDFTNYPILSTENAAVPPLVMLNMSNDHQLFYKAYDDWTDVDNDGTVDSTYKHSIDYYGYFDSYKCYSYSSGYFQPDSITSDKYCSGALWSGNFLNWASMTRMDTVRKILYGGDRYKDASSYTVLERQYLPSDAHSFAKYYKSTASEIGKLTPWSVSEITLCNTTYARDNYSEDRTEPPLIRVANGNFALWAANERYQCHWKNHSEKESNIFNSTLGNSSNNGNDPDATGLEASSDNPKWDLDRLGDGDYIVRVEVCKSKALLGNENCKRYPDGNYKPIGLLQEYGDEGRLHFGLMTGSYQKNKSGGVLRKNIGDMQDEINTLTDGTFKTAPSAGNIIGNLSALRVSGYDHDPGYYNKADSCPWGKNTFTNGICTNWGNPQSEIYLESLRYLAGKSPNFSANDSAYINNFISASSWVDPLTNANYCAKPNIINFNASVSSYDRDELTGVSDLSNFSSLKTYVDTIGSAEGVSGKVFIGKGSSATTTDGLCSPKVLSNLSDAVGICPEAPRLEAGYDTPGLAYYAKTNSIRSDITDTSGQAVDINVNTYGVSLAPALPVIKVPNKAGTDTQVTILPACRNQSVNGNCAIVDFKVVTPHTFNGADVAVGKFYVNWEDSEQGGDYDQDMAGTITYTIDYSKNQITLTTYVYADSTPNGIGFGYVLSGTTNDGFHVHSGINKFDQIVDVSGVLTCSDSSIVCETAEPETSVTYDIGQSKAKLLNPPLWYAAKWGGFTDLNNNDKPDLTNEWDDRDGNWVKGNSDGIPDNYFYAIDPATLERSLRRTFDDILARSASGTAAAVVSTSREGRGAIYQALYETQKKDGSGNDVRWVGTVRAFWIDEFGYMREDTTNNAVLDDTDKVIDISSSDGDITITYYTADSQGNLTYSGVTDGINSVTPIWDASSQLVSKTPSTRKIYTAIDSNADGQVSSGEVIEFNKTAIDANNFYYLDVADKAAADKLIDYTRGTDQPGMRSRTLAGKTYRLGDVVNSTPTVVGAPSESFDLLYQDESYATFRKKYKNRRQVVYVGANDGMLHAFNGGFFGTSGGKNTFTTSGASLGEELWAYIPMNLLPHLKWFADEDYTHMFYMDAKPRVFDAKIFSSDSTHPGGWGTVLVAGMRLGGNPTTIDSDGDGTYDKTLKSAYVVMDITDPEVTPKVLAEISMPDLGFTTSYPTAFAVRDAKKVGGDNKWYLVFGNGPNNPFKAIRDDGVNSSLYIYDLDTKDFATGYGPKDLGETENNGFLGDPVSVDWNLSFKADTLYFGTLGGSESNPTGRLYKMALNKKPSPGGWNTPKIYFNAGQPITSTPTVAWDKSFNKWVYTATGRMFVDGDQKSSSQQTIYGIRDPEDDTKLPVKLTDLVNVTSVKVYNNNYVNPGSLGLTPDTVSTGNGDGKVTFNELNDYINLYDSASDGPDKQGWYKNMPVVAGNPSTRSFSTSALMGDVLFTSAYTPGDHICNAQGQSSLYGLYYLTGTASSDLTIFGLDSNDTVTVSNVQGERILDVVTLGEGLSSSPSIHIDEPANTDGESGVTVITQTGVGSIERRNADTSSSIRSGEASWREEVVH